MLIIAGATQGQQTAGTTGIDSLVPGQLYTTGNVVIPTTTSSGSTWVGAVYQDQLTCWAGGMPGYCGPSAIVGPNNNFNFSYGSTYVYQSQNITSLLPSGSGLQVNGYNFGFMAKNGNGWDDGRTDQLSALVRFWDNTGGRAASNLLYGKVYDLNYKFDWTQFNYSENFTTPLSVASVGQVQYGFIGMDNNYWAGPYGPEVYNISFSVKYSVDPCITNPLYSPTCPGYMDALAKLIPATTTTTTTTAPTTTTDSGGTTVTLLPPPPPPGSAPPPGAPPPPGPAQPGAAPPMQTTNTSTTSATASATQNTKEGNAPNTSLALSIISKNSERDSAALSVAQTATAQAAQAAQQAQQEANSIASSAVANSQSANIVSVNGQQSSGSGIRVNNASSSSTSALSNTSVQPGAVVVSMISPQLQSSAFTTPATTSMGIEQQTSLPITILPNNNAMTATPQNYAIIPPNFLTDRTNPLTEIVEGRQVVPSSNNVTTTGPSVNKNASDNEAAGGVNINKMAVAPTGYGDYLNFAMRDVAFYAPKEVYKNQKNVDNARALRQMTNDSKHKEMVELQYAK